MMALTHIAAQALFVCLFDFVELWRIGVRSSMVECFGMAKTLLVFLGIISIRKEKNVLKFVGGQFRHIGPGVAEQGV